MHHVLAMDLTVAHYACRVVDDSTITVNGKKIKIVSNRDPLQLPWGEMVRTLRPLHLTRLPPPAGVCRRNMHALYLSPGLACNQKS